MVGWGEMRDYVEDLTIVDLGLAIQRMRRIKARERYQFAVMAYGASSAPHTKKPNDTIKKAIDEWRKLAVKEGDELEASTGLTGLEFMRDFGG